MKKWRAWFGASATAPKPAAATADLPLELPPELPVDLMAPGLFADPAPLFARLRAEHPVAAVKQGGYLLTRHADVLSALSDAALGNAPSRFSVLAASKRGRYVAADIAGNIPPFLDAPDHVRLRKALSPAFFDCLSAAQDWVPGLAERMLADHAGPEIDLVARIARPFSIAVMSRFIGLAEDPALVKRGTAAFFRLFAPVTDPEDFARTNEVLGDMRQTLRAVAQARVTAPADDLISGLAARGMSLDEVADNALLVLADGVENIEAGIALSFRMLCQRGIGIGSQDPGEVAAECLRLCSPAQLVPRVTRQETQIRGVPLPAGAPVFLALGSANLDPEAHADPGAFSLDRRDEVSLAFGRGRHSCIGAPLARLQIGAMLAALQGRNAQLVPGRQIRWHARFGHRWPVALPIALP